MGAECARLVREGISAVAGPAPNPRVTCDSGCAWLTYRGRRMTDYHASAHATLIESVDQLVEQFHLAGKPRDRWRIGTEYEKVTVERATGKAAPFSGPRGIEAVLRALAERWRWVSEEAGTRKEGLDQGGGAVCPEAGRPLVP